MTIAEITKKFEVIVEEDQEARRNRDEEAMKKIDARNTQFLKEVVDEYGWPTISKFGKQGAEHAWLLAQHADQQPDLQKKWLELMLDVRDDVDKWHIAYLTDRVMYAEKGIQRYGTQAVKNGNHWVLRPLEDKERLDELRAEMDMKPIQNYLDLQGWKEDGSLGLFINEEDFKQKTKTESDSTK